VENIVANVVGSTSKDGYTYWQLGCHIWYSEYVARCLQRGVVELVRYGFDIEIQELNKQWLVIYFYEELHAEDLGLTRFTATLHRYLPIPQDSLTDQNMDRIF